MSLAPEVSQAAKEWFLAWLLEYLAAQDAGTLEPESSTTQAARIYGQFGASGLTGRQSNLTARPGTRHTTVMIGGQRFAVGDTKKQYTRPLEPPRNSPAVVAKTPFMPNAFLACAEMLVDLDVEATVRLPSWVAYQQARGTLNYGDELWWEGFVPGGGGGGAS